MKVRVRHLRFAEVGKFALPAHELRLLGLQPQSKGGYTFVAIEYEPGRRVTGFAKCSTRDNYCKATGRQIALGRALKSAEVNG